MSDYSETVLYDLNETCLKFIVDDDGTFAIRVYTKNEESYGMQVWFRKEKGLEMLDSMRKLMVEYK